MTSTIRRRSGFAAVAAGVILLGTAACGTDSAADDVQEPIAPAAAAPTSTPSAHAPTSADAAERQGAEHSLKLRRQSAHPPFAHHEIPLP